MQFFSVDFRTTELFGFDKSLTSEKIIFWQELLNVLVSLSVLGGNIVALLLVFPLYFHQCEHPHHAHQNIKGQPQHHLGYLCLREEL